jgi:hypothetical protein
MALSSNCSAQQKQKQHQCKFIQAAQTARSFTGGSLLKPSPTLPLVLEYYNL